VRKSYTGYIDVIYRRQSRLTWRGRVKSWQTSSKIDCTHPGIPPLSM